MLKEARAAGEGGKAELVMKFCARKRKKKNPQQKLEEEKEAHHCLRAHVVRACAPGQSGEIPPGK